MVSIIVPVYNTEAFLPECIDSILRQTFSNFELLLIDDGSKDGSGVICDRYAAQDSRIRVWHIENGGVSNARNIGLQHARGEYIAFCDADDSYCGNYLAQMLSAAEETAADIVICSYYFKTESGISQPYPGGQSRFLSQEEVFERIFLRNEIGGFVWNKLFRRELLKDVAFRRDMQICEDTYFVVSAMQNCPRIYYLCEPLYEYYIRQTSAVNRVDNLITPEGVSKFTTVFRRILGDFSLSDTMKAYVQCGIFWMASSVKCDYKNAGGRDPQIIRNLNRDARETLAVYWKCRELPFCQKAVTTANWLLNLRYLKKCLTQWRAKASHEKAEKEG